MANKIDGALQVTGPATFGGGVTTLFERSQFIQDVLASYMVPLEKFRVWDALATNLPGTAAADDLALKSGTFGSVAATVQTSDSKATTVTQRMRAVNVQLPPEYEAAQTVVVRIWTQMNTTISDGTATVDVEAHKEDQQGAVGSDICATAALSINSLDWASKDFTITASSLAPGDSLDLRITIAITDTATGTAVIGEIGGVELLCDIRG